MKQDIIVGLDEAGRGPLAGPVYAAAVILPSDFPLSLLDDSKKLSEAKRKEAAKIIMEKAAFGIAFCDAAEIDKINILKASLLAMERAYNALCKSFPFYLNNDKVNSNGGDPFYLNAIVDGLYCPRLPIPCRAIVKADAKVPQVMAASILAKTERDKVMIEYARLYPQYGYDKHKGYPTKAHRDAIAQHGPSPIQRMSFRYN